MLMLTEQKNLEIPLLFKKSMQAYSHLLKDGMFPERILRIVSHSFLKSVMLFSKLKQRGEYLHKAAGGRDTALSSVG